MVLPIEYSKGLEFDAVLLFNASEENYPSEDGFARLLYVAATRALHELVVLYSGKLTDLIGTTVSEEKKQKYVVVRQEQPARRVREEKPKTNREIELERVSHGKFEMELRNRIGPKRIVVQNSIEEKRSEKARAANSPSEKSEFGVIPGTNSLRPLGHSKLNLAVRWVTGNKSYVEVTNACGVLRITPISENTVRISFAGESLGQLPEIPAEIEPTPRLKWNYREDKGRVEVKFGKLLLRIDKKNGGISFYTEKEMLLLSENPSLPRQIANAAKNQTWTYFDWSKKEVLKARGAVDQQWLDLKTTAKYISFGAKSKRPACVKSNSGYQILVPGGRRVMCCTIPMYGSYLYTEGEAQIDYFFIGGTLCEK